MAKNSDVFFVRAKEYQDKRNKIIDTYENKIKALEDAKGSKYYLDETKAAEDTRAEALAALKAEYSGYFKTVIEAMKTTNASRPMPAPTEEELRIVQLLKMKEKVTDKDLTRAANALKGSPDCLAIIDEIARKNGIMTGYLRYADNTELSITTVDEALISLEESVRDFLAFETPRATRIVAEHNERRYGVKYDAMTLPKREQFNDKAGAFRVAGQFAGTDLPQFLDAIDG